MAIFALQVRGVVISEFMADNGGIFKDEEGDSSDWIEIHNDSPIPVGLAGWHLTDSAANLAMWTFPPTNLPPDGYLIVFASDKNRAVAGMPLHTNFKLNSSGDYLALVNSNGTVVDEYSPSFPPQSANRSYGIGNQTLVTPLIVAGANARFLVPTNSALGASWTAKNFNDATWAQGSTGIGFDANGGTNPVTVLAVDFDARTGESAAANTEPGFSQMNLNANPSTFNGLTVTLSAIGGGLLDDRDRTTPAQTSSLTQDQLYDDFIFVNGMVDGNGIRIQIAGLGPNQDYRLKIWSFDSSSGGARVSDWIETASGMPNAIRTGYTFNGSTPPVNDGDDTFSATVRSSASGLLTVEGRRNGGTSHGVFLNALQLAQTGFGALIGSNVGPVMTNKNSSAYIRMPFAISNAADISNLHLRMKYDDGFIACINGQMVASRNAPPSPAWNSSATAAHSNSLALAFEEIVLPVSAGLLENGANVLAIQALNISPSDLDFLVLPELDAVTSASFPNRFFTQPTPAAPNDPGVLGLASAPDFSVPRGFYDAPFSVALASVTAGAEIRWTTNGSAPTATSGTVYTTPIQIDRTTLLRAASFKTNFAASRVVTHTYLFLAQVLQQPANLPGYPATWQGNYPADYGMDPAIANDTNSGFTVTEALRSIPTISLVTDFNSLWNASTGICVDATQSGDFWERPASLEMFEGDNTSDFQVNCGVQMQGNAGRDNARTPKHSFRFVFKSEYGPGKLNFKLFEDSPVTSFDTFILRSAWTDCWATRYSDSAVIPGTTNIGTRYRPEDSLNLRDVWVKDSHRAMGGWLAAHSNFVHLYVNGLYWGLYNDSEHVDADFVSSHLGGKPADWDVIVGSDTTSLAEGVDGSLADWAAMMATVNAGVTSDASYEAISQVVDIDNLIDYMMIHLFAEVEDWPNHNWYAAHRRATNGEPATKWIFLTWDQDIALDQLVRRNRIDVNNNDTPARIYSQLRAWPEFRREFGDRVQKHLFNGG
ncbi:MAG: CotH kinase family protein, partial [Verrucomicrobiota bacterium]